MGRVGKRVAGEGNLDAVVVKGAKVQRHVGGSAPLSLTAKVSFGPMFAGAVMRLIVVAEHIKYGARHIGR